jgi:toxin ParE1/3/4
LARIHPKGRSAFGDVYKDIVGLLLDHPGLGVRTDDPTIRRLTTPPYPFLIFYEVTEKEIVIHAVRHASRDPSGMPGSA